MDRSALGNHPLMDPPLYKRIGNYCFNLEDVIGKGNFSTVYKGRHQITREIVAIKVIELSSLKTQTLEKLLHSEIQVLKCLNHPNILRCYEIIESDHNCYIIAQLCREGSLESKLRKDGYFSEENAKTFIKDVFDGLCYLAQKNIIHRDLKVANVFVSQGRAKIADFGFAVFSTCKFKDVSIGSPIYMAPQGFIDHYYGPKTDIWAFGIFIYQLLHGHTPFHSIVNSKELYNRMITPLERNVIKGRVSQELKDVIMQCMQIDEVQRPTMNQLSRMKFFRQIQRNRRWKSQGDSIIGMIELGGKGQYRPWLSYGKDVFSTTQSKTDNKQQLYIPKAPLSLKKSCDTKKCQKTNKIYDKIIEEQLDLDIRILKGNVSFEVCLNALHYVRLIFKFIELYKPICEDEKILITFSRWLMQVLREISCKVRRKEVTYTKEKELRESKLIEVCGQYMKRYAFQLSLYLKKDGKMIEESYSLDFVKFYSYSLFEKINANMEFQQEQKNGSLIKMACFLAVICEGTKQLHSCFSKENYAVFSYFYDAQKILNGSFGVMTWDNYQKIKKKLDNF